MEDMKYPFTIHVSHFLQWANCSIKTCLYTLKFWSMWMRCALSLGTYSCLKIGNITLDEVISLEPSSKRVFFFFNFLLHTYFIWFWIFEWLLNILDLHANVVLNKVGVHLPSSGWGCQQSGHLISRGKKDLVLRAGFCFHKWETLAKYQLG